MPGRSVMTSDAMNGAVMTGDPQTTRNFSATDDVQ